LNRVKIKKPCINKTDRLILLSNVSSDKFQTEASTADTGKPMKIRFIRIILEHQDDRIALKPANGI